MQQCTLGISREDSTFFLVWTNLGVYYRALNHVNSNGDTFWRYSANIYGWFSDSLVLQNVQTLTHFDHMYFFPLNN